MAESGQGNALQRLFETMEETQQKLDNVARQQSVKFGQKTDGESFSNEGTSRWFCWNALFVRFRGI